jgi:hypothetical protein
MFLFSSNIVYKLYIFVCDFFVSQKLELKYS